MLLYCPYHCKDGSGKIMTSTSENEMHQKNAQSSVASAQQLMKWKIKAQRNYTIPLERILGTLIALSSLVYLWIYFTNHSPARDLYTTMATTPPLFLSYFWWIVRKKTVWNYTISSGGGYVEYWEDYFGSTKYFFKGLAIFAVVCILTMIAIAPGLILLTAGMGGIMIIAAIRLASWENEVEWQYFTWDRPQKIFTDRKRGMVVLERHPVPDNFWKNYLYLQVFLPKDRIDEFLAICKKYASEDVQYEEGHFVE